MVDRVSKSQLMTMVARGEMRETFEHEEEGMFDVTAMREFARANLSPIQIDLDCVVDFVKEQRVHDMQRVYDLTPDQRDEPILYVCCTEPAPLPTTYLLIDGSHRVLRRKLDNFDHVDAYVLDRAQIIRPDWSLFGRTRDLLNMDWGDDIINGKIVKVG